MLVSGMTAFSYTAEAHGHSQASVRDAQQELKSEGYYKGAVDGIDDPTTRAAIRKYQGDKNLTVNGRLDQETRNKLGVHTTAEASREAGPEATTAPSTATVSAAQRSLLKRDFIKATWMATWGKRPRQPFANTRRTAISMSPENWIKLP